MNIDELKLVLETVSDVSDGAMWVALLWIGKGYFSALVTAASVLGVTMIIARVIRFAIDGQPLVSSIARLHGFCTPLDSREEHEILKTHQKGLGR